MKRLAVFCFLTIYISSVFAFRVQDGKTNAWATYYTEAGYQRSLINQFDEASHGKQNDGMPRTQLLKETSRARLETFITFFVK